MRPDLAALSPTILALVLAGVTTYFTGGAFRGATFLPGDERMRRIARATWWVSPGLVTLAGVLSAVAVRESPAVSLLMLVCGAACSVASWRWRPVRADELRNPRWIARLRSAVPIPLRDAAAWRRQAVELVVAVAVLVVPLVVLRLG